MWVQTVAMPRVNMWVQTVAMPRVKGGVPCGVVLVKSTLSLSDEDHVGSAVLAICCGFLPLPVTRGVLAVLGDVLLAQGEPLAELGVLMGILDKLPGERSVSSIARGELLTE